MSTEQPKGGSDVAGGERRDVAADQHDRARRAGRQSAPHADAKIPFALTGNLSAAPPMTGLTACDVRRYRDAQPPAPVCGEPAQEERQHQSLKAHRRDIPDRLRQTAFAAAHLRCPDKENQMAVHQP